MTLLVSSADARNLKLMAFDVDGVLTLLWHNETVSECNEWQGWRTVYEQVFERVC